MFTEAEMIELCREIAEETLDADYYIEDLIVMQMADYYLYDNE